jgi:hypothetical protein
MTKYMAKRKKKIRYFQSPQGASSNAAITSLNRIFDSYRGTSLLDSRFLLYAPRPRIIIKDRSAYSALDDHR